MTTEDREKRLVKYMSPSFGCIVIMLLLAAAVLFFLVMTAVTLITGKGAENSLRVLWLTLAGITALLALAALVVFLKQKKQISRSMTGLTEEDRAAASEELENFKKERRKKNAIVGERFLFVKPAVMKYSDITWVYPRIMRVNGVKVELLVVNTDYMKEVTVNGSLKKEMQEDIYTRCRMANPEVLIGYSLDNKKAYDARYKAYRKASRRTEE